MNENFIRNEQLNFIREQVALIQDSRKKSLPSNVLKAVIDVANAKIADLFSEATLEQKDMLDVAKLQTDEEYEQYLMTLLEHIQPFPYITEQQLKKMFPKQKKLKLPDLSTMKHYQMTYLSWNDLRSNRKYIIHELDGKLIGIECEFSPTTKKNICSFCNKIAPVTFCSTTTKAKQAKNPDYYKAIGNYICADGTLCNRNITQTEALTNFLRTTIKQ